MSSSQLMNVRDQSNEKPRPSNCSRIRAAQVSTHSRGASPCSIAPSSAGRPKASQPSAVDAQLERAQRGGKAEGVEAERVEHRIAAGTPEAGVGVADRVAADVAHVGGARGE